MTSNHNEILHTNYNDNQHPIHNTFLRQQPNTMQSLGEIGYNGSVLYGKFQGLLAGVLCIIGLVLFLFGIKLFFTNESNWKQKHVTIKKVSSSNNKTCDKDILTNKYDNNTTQHTVYNCMIHVDFNGKDVILQVLDSPNNYIVGQNMLVWYDLNNVDQDPIINKILLSKMWWMFLLGGLILFILSFMFVYFIMKNDNFSAIVGTGSFINNFFR